MIEKIKNYIDRRNGRALKYQKYFTIYILTVGLVPMILVIYFMSIGRMVYTLVTCGVFFLGYYGSAFLWPVEERDKDD